MSLMIGKKEKLPPDIFKVRTHICVDYSNLDNFLAKEFPNIEPNRIGFIACYEMSNDSEMTIVVDGKLEDEDEEAIKEAETREPDAWGLPGILMNKLAQRGKLSVGTYLVSVCW